MSYLKAKECFEDSLRYIDTKKEPVSHDLNVGLYNLTKALQSDIEDIRQSLAQIANVLQQLSRK